MELGKLYLNWFFLSQDFVVDLGVKGEVKEKLLRLIGAEELRTSMDEDDDRRVKEERAS